MQQHTIPVSGSSVYEETTKELDKLVHDEGHQKHIDAQFREVRGRETIRTHLTLKAVSDADRRATQQSQALMSNIVQMGQELQERTRHLAQLIETFEATSGKQFGGVHDDLRTRAEGLASTLAKLQHEGAQNHTAITLQVQETRSVLANQLNTNRETLEALMRQMNESFQAQKSQVGAFQQGVTMQVQEARAALSHQNREETERVVQDVRQARDEVVAMLDSRMNQADASFAALRGDVEVVKFLVMDLIKDRIGRADPKSKTY